MSNTSGSNQDHSLHTEPMEQILWVVVGSMFSSLVGRMLIKRRPDFSLADYVVYFACVIVACLVAGVLGTVIVRKYATWAATVVASVLAFIIVVGVLAVFWFVKHRWT